MIRLEHLPALNATLNAVAFVLLVVGHRFIMKGNVAAHKRCMISVYCLSIAFLVSYLTYRFCGAEKKFGGQGWIRPAYFVLLISHVSLAATVPVLASWTLYRALKGQFDKHRRLARLTYPIWVYVSITGIIVYVLLFQIYGPARAG